MDSPKITYRYYSNPAFCAQSEVVFTQQSPCVSPRIVPSPDRPRMSPLGANSPRKLVYESIPDRIRQNSIISNNSRCDEPPELPPKPAKFVRNGSITSTLQSRRSIRSSKRRVRARTLSEDLEMSSISADDSKLHRYEVIKDYEDEDFSPTKKRIVESETDEYNVDGPDENEMKAIPTEIVKTVNGKTHRYAIVPSDDDYAPKKPQVTFSPPMPKQQLIATQKLHELLSTPRRQTLKSYASQPSVRFISPESRLRNETKTYAVAPTTRTLQMISSKSCANLIVKELSPRAQQKLVYDEFEMNPDVFTRSARQRSIDRARAKRERNRSLDLDRSLDWEKRDVDVHRYEREVGRSRFFDRNDRNRSPKKIDRNMAVISPRLAPRAPSDSTYDSYGTWAPAKPSQAAKASLAVAAVMLTLCGALATGLSFYMMYAVGRMYYLDFSVLTGFTCFLLGSLGFRTRSHQLLPNRNYISGYVLLSTFSILICAGLLAILILNPPLGTALKDITSGGVCALSVLSLFVASWGVIASYCCKKPPPDNRVGHL